MNALFSRIAATLAGAALVAICLVITPARSAGQDDARDALVAVLNARNPTRQLSGAQVRAMFLGTTSFWHGVVPVRVFARPASSPASAAIASLLGMSHQRFVEHWQARQLAGQGVAPATIGTVQELAQQVARSPGGVALVMASEAWSVEDVPGARVVPID